ncbi:uncharacterized protein LOC135976408 [Chrysemys picta bellii]|uniref:uncharacterized protein LOC135976408 n=1 Tax=Chrysemys picta bellii TaxID=8478 RepID=UPI0032B10599
MSSQEGDTVVIKCNIPSLFHFTRVIFCKDGVEIAVLPMKEKQYAYDFNHKASTDSSEELSCMYQYKNENNQVNNSRLSAPQYLTDFKGFSASYGFVLILVFGITILSALVLLLVGYILEKTGIIKCREAREQDPEDIYWGAEYQPNCKKKFIVTSPIFIHNSVHLTCQEICSSPGFLSAPQIFLNKKTSHEGETVVVKCKVPAFSNFTRVIFCEDITDLAVLPMQENKFAYDLHYKVSTSSSGRFVCLYEHKDTHNQEYRSFLSAPQYLNVTAKASGCSHSTCKEQQPTKGLSLPAILGISVPLLLVLVVACSLMVKKVQSKKRPIREQSPRYINATITEDQLHYASIVGHGSDTSFPIRREESVIYSQLTFIPRQGVVDPPDS